MTEETTRKLNLEDYEPHELVDHLLGKKDLCAKKKREIVAALPGGGCVALMVDDARWVITDRKIVVGFLVERSPSGHVVTRPLGTDGILNDGDEMAAILHADGTVEWPTLGSWPSLAAFEKYLEQQREESIQTLAKGIAEQRETQGEETT